MESGDTYGSSNFAQQLAATSHPGLHLPSVSDRQRMGRDKGHKGYSVYPLRLRRSTR